VSSIFLCGWLNIRKWANNPRIYIIALLLMAFLFAQLSGIRDFCAGAQIGVTPWLFPFIMDDLFCLFVVMLGIVLLFCDAPFVDSHQPAVIMRMGKPAWALGQIWYIMIASALYFAAVIALSILVMIPYVGFSAAWGDVILTIAQMGAGVQGLAGVGFNYSVILDYSPLSAMVWCFVLSWLIGVFIGLINFIVNQMFGRGFGTAAVLALMFMIFFMFGTEELFGLDIGSFRASVTTHYFMPVSWASLSLLDLTYSKPFPPREFALWALIVFNIVLSALAVLSVKKRNIQVLPPV
jgi:hypothetical protein